VEPFQGDAILENTPFAGQSIDEEFIKKQYKINSLKGLMMLMLNGSGAFSVDIPEKGFLLNQLLPTGKKLLSTA